MSYYDPKIYNFANLDEGDKQEITCMLEMTRNALANAYFNDDFDLEKEPLAKIIKEIQKETLMKAWNMYLCSIVDLMVSFIDDYDHDVPSRDADNYFFGCEVDDLFKEDDCDSNTEAN